MTTRRCPAAGRTGPATAFGARRSTGLPSHALHLAARAQVTATTILISAFSQDTVFVSLGTPSTFAPLLGRLHLSLLLRHFARQTTPPFGCEAGVLLV